MQHLRVLTCRRNESGGEAKRSTAATDADIRADQEEVVLFCSAGDESGTARRQGKIKRYCLVSQISAGAIAY